MHRLTRIILVSFAVCFFSSARAEPAPHTDLIASWLVTVEGEKRPRTLKIIGVKQETATVFTLDAAYGWTDEKQTPITAEVRQNGQERILSVITQSASKIAARQVSAGIFAGTFTLANGVTKPILIEKLSDDEFRLRLRPTVETPASNVPPSCRSFTGGWVGRWSGFNLAWLWIVQVNADCTVKYSFGHWFPRTFATAEIKKGTLSIPCGTNSGTCSFSSHGDELWGNYYGPDGGNQGVWETIK